MYKVGEDDRVVFEIGPTLTSFPFTTRVSGSAFSSQYRVVDADIWIRRIIERSPKVVSVKDQVKLANQT